MALDESNQHSLMSTPKLDSSTGGVLIAHLQSVLENAKAGRSPSITVDIEDAS